MSNGVGSIRSNPHEVLAHFVNYLNASLYESRFTQKHEEARAHLNSNYDALAASPEKEPTYEQLVSFYNDICVLEKITDTDDPIYYTYKRLLRRYIASLETTSTSTSTSTSTPV